MPMLPKHVLAFSHVRKPMDTAFVVWEALCPGLGWDRVHFHPSGWYSAVFCM